MKISVATNGRRILKRFRLRRLEETNKPTSGR